MNILKNDVIAILGQKVNSISARSGRSSTFVPGPDKQVRWAIKVHRVQQYLVFSFSTVGHIGKASTLEKIVYPKIRSHFS